MPGAGEIFAYGTAVYLEETEESLGNLMVMEDESSDEPIAEYP